VLGVACGSLLLLMPAPTRAEDPSTDVEAVPQGADDQHPTPEELQRQAAQIRDLIAGRLDLSVDPQTLFTVTLDDPDAARQAGTLIEQLDQRARQPRRSRRAEPRTPQENRDPVESAEDALTRAWLDFLSLPAEKRRQLLEEHRRRQQLAKAGDEAALAHQQQLDSLEVQAAQLEAFLDGTLDPSVDARALFRVDLLASDEVALDPERRRSFVQGDSPKPSTAEPGPSSIEARIDAARARVDSLRRRFVALAEETREELFEAHRKKALDEETAAQIDDAEEAARRAAEERQQAVEEAETAQSEALKLVADRRAVLLSVKEDQALYSASLAKQRSDAEAVLESALGWSRRVKELEEGPLEDQTRSRRADELYPRVERDLAEARDTLSAALSLTTSAEWPVPSPPAEDATPLSVELDDGSLRALREELQDEAARLAAEEGELSWNRATILRDAVVLMNQARLRLFDQLSESERDRLTGFGPASAKEVKDELAQITLEAKYSLLSLPRELLELRERLRTSPGSVVAMLVQVLLLVLVFVWWRRRADSILARLQRTWLQKRPQNGFTRGVAGLAWYLRRIRKPLEWLIFLAILAEVIVARFGTFIEPTYVRIVVVWALAGAFVVRLIDAIADRQGYSSEFSSKLRFRSLRLVGVTIVIVGLVLSITDTTVGKGAIYVWVIKTFWFLAIPVGAVLVYWWSDTIFERASAQESNAVLRWVAKHNRGVLKFVAATVGGIYLLVDGIYHFILTQATELAPARRLLSYLSRREVEKQASGPDATTDEQPISPELYEKLRPDAISEEELVRSYMSPQVHAMRALVRSERASIVAVTGERGEGKTTFLGRIVSDLDDRDWYEVGCQAGGFASVVAQLAKKVDLPPGADEAQVIARLNERAPRVVSIDDAHRLIKPLIGGLKDIDDLIRFMRGGHPETSWLIGISMPAWHYLQRARAQRTGFDEVIELVPWEEEQIVKLVEARTEAAGIDPSFDDLVVPQQFAVSRGSDEERTRRDFYRILSDYAGGNPLVALHFWRESLYVRPSDGRISVRIPKVPSLRELDNQPNALYFVLRTITQLERASEDDIVRCTDLAHADVADALRAARVQGYIEKRDQLFEVRTEWYRAITGILRRKHLMLL